MKQITEILRPVKRSRGGQRPDHRKSTAELESVYFTPDEVVIPLLMHIGAPCEPLVKKGDRVLAGQLIADSDSPMSAPIHASITGTVKDIAPISLPNGRTVAAVTIEADQSGEVYPVSVPKASDTDAFIEAVHDSGLVGLGGAGFPAAVKLKPSGKQIDTLVINAAECEPFITADYRECLECADSIMDGVYMLTKQLKLSNVIICVEDNKPKAIEVLANIAAADDRVDDKVKLMKLPSSYPQGAEKVLVYSATGRTVPAGGLPADVGCIVMNITSVSFLGKYFKTGMPLISKRVTVAGDAVKEPKNVIVPIGTRIKDIIEFCGGCSQPVKKLIQGGPMMGTAISDDALPIMKAGNAVLAFGEKMAAPPEITACIRCGRCVNTCPMNLMPVQIEQALMADNTDKLVKLNVLCCMECGCCAYGCPARRPLVQSMRLAKQKVRGRK